MRTGSRYQLNGVKMRQNLQADMHVQPMLMVALFYL